MTTAHTPVPPRARLLLVDDQPINIQTLYQIFHDDHDVFMATDGPQALAFCRETPPDLILLDVVMPGMDGLEVCRQLKATARTAGIPVIFVTAQSDPADETRALEAGGVDFITKPVNPTVVRARVKTHLTLKAQSDHLEQLVETRTAALSIAKEAAEAANRAKTMFLANMSHELHTPLNGITGFTGLAMRLTTDPKLKDYLARVEKASQNLLAIINDVLDIAKLEAERLTLEDGTLQPGELLARVEKLIGPQAAAKGLELRIDLPPELAQRTLRGDAARLEQILLNLVGNAVKFTATGTVLVTVALTGETMGSAWLRFTVKDTGIGIADTDLYRIFQPFVQADGSLTRKYGGTGLGLAISKRLAELMGGEMDVDSQPDQGSTFWFTVKLAKPATPS